MKFKFLLLLIVPLFSFSQTTFLRSITGVVALYQIDKNRTESLSYEGSKNAVVVFKNDTIKGSFEMKRGYLIKDETLIDLFDKQLTYINFEEDANHVVIKRLSNFDDKLHRVLLEAEQFTMYASSISANTDSFLFAYNNVVYRLKRSVFRSREANLKKTFDKIPLAAADKEKLYKKVIEYYTTHEI